MAKSKRFTTTLKRIRGGTMIELPFDVKEVFGVGRAPVVATVAGHTYRTTAARYAGTPMIPVARAVREAAGIAEGEQVTVTLRLDEEERIVDVPDDLRTALARKAAVRRTFEGLSFTHQKEYVSWIMEAKRPETRARRIAKTVNMLGEGLKTPR